MEHKIDLAIGYTDDKGAVHRDVTFARRTSVKDMLLLDSNPMAQNVSQYEQLIRRIMITKFGDLKCPVSLNVLAALDTYDDDALRRGAHTFIQLSREGREIDFLDGDECRLMFGVEIDGVTYDTVRFGRRLTVADNIEATNRGLDAGIGRLCFQIAKQIIEVKDSKTGLSFAGDFTADHLLNVDSQDLDGLRHAAEFFRLAPPQTREVISEGDSTNDSGDRKGDGLDGKGSDQSSG